ncbi:MAG: prolipoprotein diacylglyceryl transferase [Proteobacteria bacterium]|nr:prolipoprotein diacylglyceryl transferase [Pseudomonadota bacterium]MBU1713619.1 prolipoprotein diacylglyceryl transferase [Pseudomonadota bacterium]
MFPVLLKIGPISIFTYGFFIAIGFLAGIFLATKEAKRLGADPEKIMDLCFYILIAAIFGSRLFYVVTSPEIFLKDPVEILKVWNGGLVFYGGFIAALITGIIYLRAKNIPVWKTADIMAPSVALAHFFGRIGCFFAGCCYGKYCDLPWAVTFNHTDSLAPTGIPLHPTQLYSALNNLAIFFLLWFFRKRKKYDGQIFWMYVLLYGITRPVIETFRADFRGDYIFGNLSVSQVIGGGMAVLSVVMLLILSRRAKTK